jgi:hypothetical protein
LFAELRSSLTKHPGCSEAAGVLAVMRSVASSRPEEIPTGVRVMQCAACGAGIADEAMRCEFCNRPVERPSAVGPSTVRAAVPRPEKYHVEDDGAVLRIGWTWFSPVVFVLLPFALAWNAFLFGWYGMATTGMDFAPGFMRIMFLIFPLGHVAVGVGLIYAVLTMLFNRSEVRVERGVLSIAHGPIYWPGVTVNADDIEQLFCAPIVTKGENSTSTAYEVRARLKDGGTRALLKHVTELDQALYLEQSLERHLKLPDVPVAGEVPRA